MMQGIAVMKEHGTYLVSDPLSRDWMIEERGDLDAPPCAEFIVRRRRSLAGGAARMSQQAFASGVKVALGTDAAVYPHGMNGHELAESW